MIRYSACYNGKRIFKNPLFSSRLFLKIYLGYISDKHVIYTLNHFAKIRD